MKIRVLWVGEATFLNTGYSVYGRELLSRLSQVEGLEVAEMACYASPNDPRTRQTPWKVYPVVPHEEDRARTEQYKNNPTFQFGEGTFDEILLDFKPHVVLDIRDVFMFDFQDRSPLREYFYNILMPTVDSAPQNRQWLDILSRTEAVLTYQDWSADVIRKEGNGRINWVGSAPPSADVAFKPLDKTETKKLLGLEGKTIIGTVMRNQRRKLFPELFRTFRAYLDQSKRTDVLLYCHTSYPDMGWDLPALLNEHGLNSRVLFTYLCRNCQSAHASFFNGQLSICPSCNHLSASPCNVQNGLDNNTLARIYNLFDVYVQYAVAEGFGMPIAEAAACGVPIIGTDYSAMEDIIRKLNGKPVRLLTKQLELETGCYRAVPDNDHLLSIFTECLSLSPDELKAWSKKTLEGYHKNYGWNKTAQVWLDAISKVPIQNYENQWYQPAKLFNPVQPNYEMSNKDFAKFLIVNVLGEPHRLNSLLHMRLEKDLNSGCTGSVVAGMYYNEQSQMFGRPVQEAFNKEIAYKHFYELRQRKNQWEQIRVNSLRK
jgi:glycosyltransferase involved in cell wall biosynthesis